MSNVSYAYKANPLDQIDTESTGTLHRQIEQARLWLPLSIVAVVFLHQLVVVPLGDEHWQFWTQLLFYSILGPIVTFVTLAWIAFQVRERELAQKELRHLYEELQASHGLLRTIQTVTEKFASATDLEGVLAVASQSIAEATNAKGTAILIGEGDLGMIHSSGLNQQMIDDAAKRNLTFLRGEEKHLENDNKYIVLSAAIVWGGKREGSLHAYYEMPPSPEVHKSFSILSSEFSAIAEATRSRTRDLLTLFEADRSIRAEGNLENLLATLLIQMMTRVEATIGGVYLADEENFLQLKTQKGFNCYPNATPLRIGEGLIGKVAKSAKPCIISELDKGERENFLSARSAVFLPLMIKQELLGVVVLAHTKTNHFYRVNLPFLGLLAGQVSLAVRNARAYLHSEELAIAEERARIAREIHDGVAQMLAFSALKLDLISKLINQEKLARSQMELAQARSTIRETIKEVRRSIFALRPIDLEHHGFIETLRRYVYDYGQQNDVSVELDIQAMPKLTVKSEVVLFRIFQESMHNVAKHAKANKVLVCAGTAKNNHAFIEVVDNGKGFDVKAVTDRVTSAGGLGLKQMRERIEDRGGCFEISSSLGEGTKVFASLAE